MALFWLDEIFFGGTVADSEIAVQTNGIKRAISILAMGKTLFGFHGVPSRRQYGGERGKERQLQYYSRFESNAKIIATPAATSSSPDEPNQYGS